MVLASAAAARATGVPRFPWSPRLRGRRRLPGALGYQRVVAPHHRRRRGRLTVWRRWPVRAQCPPGAGEWTHRRARLRSNGGTVLRKSLDAPPRPQQARAPRTQHVHQHPPCTCPSWLCHAPPRRRRRCHPSGRSAPQRRRRTTLPWRSWASSASVTAIERGGGAGLSCTWGVRPRRRVRAPSMAIVTCRGCFTTPEKATPRQRRRCRWHCLKECDGVGSPPRMRARAKPQGTRGPGACRTVSTFACDGQLCLLDPEHTWVASHHRVRAPPSARC